MDSTGTNLKWLPDEIGLRITSYLDRKALPTYARVSRNLNRCVTSLLYQSVYFKEFVETSKDLEWELGAWKHYYVSMRPTINGAGREHTEIRDPIGFLHTVQTVEGVRPLIHYACFAWIDNGHVYGSNTIHAILRLLKRTTRMRLFHVSPHRFNHNFLDDLAASSLQIHAVEDLGVPYSGTASYDEKHSLYSAFGLLNLDRLSLDQVRSWSYFEDLRSLNKAGSSCITHLCLTNSAVPGPDLFEVLQWPKALRSFYYEVSPYCDQREPGSLGNISTASFLAPLWAHRESLEELFLSFRWKQYHSDVSNVSILRQFNRLKRLGIPKDLLVPSKERLDFDLPDAELLKLFAAATKALPPSLTELQIEVPGYTEWEDYFNGSVPWHMHHEMLTLGNLLKQIAERKSKAYPELREVIIWSVTASKVEGARALVDSHEMCKRFLAMLKCEAIDFSWSLDQFSPMFTLVSMGAHSTSEH